MATSASPIRYVVDISDERTDDYPMECVKPVPGLLDAPLLWQAASTLHECDMSGDKARLGENCFTWRNNDHLTMATTLHIDDLRPVGLQPWLDGGHDLIEKTFGKITRRTPPFTHLGC